MFWWRGPPDNFGDWIGPYLYRARTGHEPLYRRPNNRSPTTTLVTAGSLIHTVQQDCVVWGSGIIRRNSPVRRPQETLAVRGPLTRQRFLVLGYPCPEVYGDPAILMPLHCNPGPSSGLPLALVPHYVHFEEAVRLYGSEPAVRIVDVRQPVEVVVQAITSCPAVISSSLHGLIIAHSYGLPAARGVFATGLGGDGVKFDDYLLSGGVYETPEPVFLSNVRPVDELVSLANEAPFPDLESLRPGLLVSCPF